MKVFFNPIPSAQGPPVGKFSISSLREKAIGSPPHRDGAPSLCRLMTAAKSHNCRAIVAGLEATHRFPDPVRILVLTRWSL